MRTQSHNHPQGSGHRSLLGVSIAIGAGIGAGIENMGAGVAIGVALGTFLNNRRKNSNHPKTS